MFATDQAAFEFLICEVHPELSQNLVTLVELKGAKAGADYALEFMRQTPNWDEAEETDAKLAAAIRQAMQYIQDNVADWFIAGEVEFMNGQFIATFKPATSRNAKEIRLAYNQMRQFRSN